jgi:hypothetical protein
VVSENNQTPDAANDGSQNPKQDEGSPEHGSPMAANAAPISNCERREPENKKTNWTELFAFVAAIGGIAAAIFSGAQAWIASDTEQRQLRAYVSAKIEQYPDINSASIDFSVVYKNNGQTPAFKMRAWVYMLVNDYPLPKSVVEQIKIHQEKVTGDVSTLFPGEERHAVTIKGISQNGQTAILTEAERDAVKAGWKTLWVVGQILYKDAFGSDRFTNYRLFESGPYMTTVNKLFWAEEGNDAN